jgi:hypothetical protein
VRLIVAILSIAMALDRPSTFPAGRMIAKDGLLRDERNRPIVLAAPTVSCSAVIFR